jgi:ArsR family transcriptional regulator
MHADVCKALAHPIRIEIIDSLQSGERSFGQLLETIGGLKSTLSQHLSIMVAKGLLKQRKKGQVTYYKLSSKKVSTACRLMREVLIEYLENQKTILNEI